MTETINQPLVSTEGKLDWEALLEKALTAPGNIGSQYSAFYNYSWLNTILLYSQNAQGPVATYNRWRDLNRQVRRGEKAMTIIRPINVKTKELDEHGEPKRLLRFKPVRAIFDVTQTDGDDLPAVDPPDWELERALTTLDIKQVPYELLDGNIQGYSTGREFALNPAARWPFKTTLHELAHITLGHTTESSHAEYARHRGVMEFQAEGSAYLVGHELGVLGEDEAADARGYVQHWMRGQRPPERAIREVFSATDKLIRAGRPAVDDMVELEA